MPVLQLLDPGLCMAVSPRLKRADYVLAKRCKLKLKLGALQSSLLRIIGGLAHATDGRVEVVRIALTLRQPCPCERSPAYSRNTL